MTTIDQRRKIATIVAIDAVGYSRQSEIDEAGTFREINALRQRIEASAAAHGGRLFNTAGDGFLLEFASASDVIPFIDELFTSERVPLRAGAHSGEVYTTESGDLLGHGVNVAARLESIAKPGELILSDQVVKALPKRLASGVRPKGSVKLEKMKTRVRIASWVGPWRVSRRPSFLASKRFFALAATLTLVIAALAIWLLNRPPARYTLADVELIARSADAETQPALSPDGRFIVYAAVPPGSSTLAADLYLQNSAGGEPIRLTDTPQDDELAPAWSPTGDRIAFARAGPPSFPFEQRGNCRIFVRLAPQGQERQVGECERAFFTGRLSWDPAGETLIFSDYVVAPDGSENARVRELNLADGRVRTIVPGATGANDTNAAYSRDGEYIGFMRYNGDSGDLHVLNLSTGRVRRLTNDGVQAFLAWAADSRSIVLASRRGGAWGLWQVQVERLEPPRRMGLDFRDLGRLSVAGDLIAFETATRITNLRRITQDGESAVTDGSQIDAQPVFSNQGALAFLRQQGGLWIYMQAPNAQPRALLRLEVQLGQSGASQHALPTLSGSTHLSGLHWSPDGTRLAFVGARAGATHLYIANVASGRVQEIASPGIAARVVDWGLDGQSLIFSGADAEGYRLWRLELSGASSPAPFSDYGWWSVHVAPEGVFAERVHEPGVWRLDPAGAELLTPEVNDRGDIPSWTIFRGRIYYVYVQNSENARLFSRPTAGGAVTFHAHIPTPYDGGGLALDPTTGDFIYARLMSSSDDIGLARLALE